MPKQIKTPAKVTEKDTKSEIFSAYQELLEEINAPVEKDATLEQEKIIIDNAAKETVEKITTDLSQLRITANQTISNLTEKLTAEAERFSALQKALALAKKELEDIHQIKIRAGMLQRMVELQKLEEERFGQEMTAKRQSWDNEQKEYEQRVARERTRETEEYNYEQQIKHKKEHDVWEEEKQKREKVLTDKEEKLSDQMQELEDLRKQAAQFQIAMDKAVKEAIAKTIVDERKEAQIRANFTKQETDTRIQIATLKIASLEKIVKDQTDEIIELKRQLETATRQVKDIAVAVIEGPKRERETDFSSKPTIPPQK
jgi:hypothetical protein